jgi:hypothetical protein
MKPKFKTMLAWEQAQVLMQPAFIRTIDNVRKQLDNSQWQGSYKEINEPLPGYHLCLSNRDRSIEVDLWDLCYQVCFSNYHPDITDNFDRNDSDSNSYEVEIDTRLIDETGEIDWHLLEAKTQKLVQDIFDRLS